MGRHRGGGGAAAGVPGATTSPGRQLIQWDCHGGTNQQFGVTHSGDGTDSYRSVASGLCLDIAGEFGDDGAALIQWTCHSGTNQRFAPTASGDGVVALVAQSSGKCVDVPDATADAGARLQQWQCYSDAAQGFRVTPAGGGTTPPAPPVSGGAQPVGVPGSYTQVYSGEFDGSSLDTSKWGYGSGDGARYGYGYPADGMVTVGNGLLDLHVHRDSATHYSTGFVNSRNQFAADHGVAEARIKGLKGTGFISAFWMLPQAGGWPPELDVLELLGKDTKTPTGTIWWDNGSGPQADSGWYSPGVDYSADFHTFSVTWDRSSVHWYVDGVEMRKAFTDPSKITDKKMYLELETSVGDPSDTWTGPPDASTSADASMQVDYVRVWQ